MKFRFYNYNTFIIESGTRKIAIDPGVSFYIFNFGKGLIPKEDWNGLSHLFITHGDPDHADDAANIAKETGARIVGGKGLLEGHKDLQKALDADNISDYKEITMGEQLLSDDIEVEALEAKHGNLPISLIPGIVKITGEVVDATHGGFRVYLGPLKIFETKKPMIVKTRGTTRLFMGLLGYEIDNIPFAAGSVGLKLTFEGKTIVNLGDTLLMDSWNEMNPDVLMIPIGGRKINNTMDEREALEAVRRIQPKLVIPTHYDCPFLFNKKANPADAEMFKHEVEQMGIECNIMKNGDEITI